MYLVWLGGKFVVTIWRLPLGCGGQNPAGLNKWFLPLLVARRVSSSGTDKLAKNDRFRRDTGDIKPPPCRIEEPRLHSTFLQRSINQDMASIESQIHAAASRNAELLAILGRTDYAKPALQQQNEYIGDLETSSAANKKEVSKLTAALAKEQKDHEKYRDSVMRRFAYKATGQKEKFAANAEKEEREYFDTMNAERLAKDEGEHLVKQLDEARKVKRDLEPIAAEHDRAQKDLDNLYNSIFAGQTPSFPEEDQQENVVRQANDEYQRLQSLLRTQQQAQQVLDGARRAMGNALGNVEQALSASRMDMFGGGAMADYMERSALGQAEAAAREAYRLTDQAMSMSDVVRPMPTVNIAQGNLLGDLLFDSTFSDYNFHQKIKATREDVQRAAQALAQNQAAVDQRCNELRQHMSNASKWLEDARKQLQKMREGIFARGTGQM